MKNTWLIFVVLLAGCGPSQPKHYELVGSRNEHAHMVYVPRAYANDKSAYEQAIRDICRDRDQIYIVMFWNDRSQVWLTNQSVMRDEQVAAQVAGYNRNPRSRLDNFYWLRDGNKVDVGPVLGGF